ncbi:hypothetical protein H1220_06085 [Carnobacteriaceae bacterium zg-84]|uniref:hypothetical protein n=1 Tax=Granulicatella sp. zg-84 TaxID=2678503 RepID=UPI0013D748C0|nr:hypothetical protein [Granulicatella sp. zg-84]QMI85289.1 hypothetical protein H1220_06085 [Carnobacteriaceae bacterium zg-84]
MIQQFVFEQTQIDINHLYDLLDNRIISEQTGTINQGKGRIDNDVNGGVIYYDNKQILSVFKK